MKRLHLNLDLTSVIIFIAVGVLLPVLLSTAVGIVALAIAEDAGGIVTGVLVVSFAATAAGCGLVAVLLTGKKARLARRQADFVANVSHELRTPLSAIRLYAQTLESGKVEGDAAKTAECVATILRETEWLDVMIDRVLTWRAASQDMMPLSLVRGPVTAAVEGAVERFRSMVPADEIDVACEAAAHRSAEHDERALHVAVLNLLTNAYKYSGPDRRIRVRTLDEGDEVVIDVEDNGVGMTPHQVRQACEPFYRADHAGDGASGVGLGLAIVRYLVQRQHGILAVDSKPGQGSRFRIRLPAAEETP